MKKKLLTALMAAVMTAVCAFGFTACGGDNGNTGNGGNIGGGDNNTGDNDRNTDIGNYKDFKKFNKEFAIEGLDDGAVPQGITAYYSNYKAIDETGKEVTRSQQYFLISAYMYDGSPSRIYVTG